MSPIKWYDAETEPPKEDCMVWVKRKGKDKPEMARYDKANNVYGDHFTPEHEKNWDVVFFRDVVYWTHLEPPEFYD